MDARPAFHLAWAGLATLSGLAGCFGNDGGSEAPIPPTAFVWIDPFSSKVDTTSIDLRGEAECDNCPPATDWQQGSCPVISCPDTRLDVYWTNQTAGTTGSAAHYIVPRCHCPPFAYNYCYSACDHVWWATVSLIYGANQVEVSASGPAYRTGTATAQVERVPLAPAWTVVQPGAGELTLGWSAVDGATSYNLYWSTTPYGWSSLCERIPDVSSPYTHTGLASGVTYYYYVTARVGDAESFDSPRLAATPN